MARPHLTIAQNLRWADAHRRHTGSWRTARSGPVRGAPGERWRGIDRALWHGFRGLPGGDTLARLLVRRGRCPPLSAYRCACLKSEEMMELHQRDLALAYLGDDGRLPVEWSDPETYRIGHPVDASG
jgi:hypothetical protein